MLQSKTLTPFPYGCYLLRCPHRPTPRPTPKKMLAQQSAVIHQLAQDQAQQRSFYRLLHNPRLTTQQVKEYLYQDCQRQVVEGAHYLVIQDTTQLDFTHNQANISQREGLGVVGSNLLEHVGFNLHPCLVLEADSQHCIGFSELTTWSRPAQQPSKTSRRYSRQPLEQKESYRWIAAAQASKNRLAQAGQLTVIADREADLNAFFQQVPDERTHLLVRPCQDRLVSQSQDSLYALLASQPMVGQFDLPIRGDTRSGRVGRLASITLRCCALQLAPQALKGELIALYGLEACEQNPPAGQAPIRWRLLTTHPVETAQQARQLTEWYSARWHIEQAFRLLKQQGMQVEKLELETGKALIQMSLLSLLVVSKVLVLRLSVQGNQGQPLGKTFSVAQLACLRALSGRYAGKGDKERNPYPPDSLAWSYWVIARLGGWKPHEKQAGVLSLMRGLRRFYSILDGWQLAHQDVS